MPWAMCDNVSKMIVEYFWNVFIANFKICGFWPKLTISMAAPAAPKVSAIRHWASRRWKRHHRDFGTPPEGGCGWYLKLVLGTSQDTSPILANFPVHVTLASVRFLNIWNINPYNGYTYYLYTYYSKLSSLFSQDLHFRHPSLYAIVLYEIGHWWNACPVRTKLDQPSKLGSLHGRRSSEQRRESKRFSRCNKKDPTFTHTQTTCKGLLQVSNLEFSSCWSIASLFHRKTWVTLCPASNASEALIPCPLRLPHDE